MNNYNSIIIKKKKKKTDNDVDVDYSDDDDSDDDYEFEISYTISFNIFHQYYKHHHHHHHEHDHDQNYNDLKQLKEINIEFHSIIITSYSQLLSFLSQPSDIKINNYIHPLTSPPPLSSSMSAKTLLYFQSKARIIIEDQLSSGK